jgi:ABC-type lipoprotein export system ATPase subunit
VLENVLLPTIPAAGNDASQRAHDLLKSVGLSNHMDYRPAQLSGGEQQRVAVVRALINNPLLLLADEPTGSLDQKNSDKLGDILLRLNREEEVTLIMVTHSQNLAGKMATVYHLTDGLLTTGEM